MQDYHDIKKKEREEVENKEMKRDIGQSLEVADHLVNEDLDNHISRSS